MIILSGHSEERSVVAARDAGANEFCKKPLTVASLVGKIAAVINHPRIFVRSEDYTGPDRRRQSQYGYAGEERRRPIAAR